MTSPYASIAQYWPYAAAVAGALVVLLVLIYNFGGITGRRGAVWKYTAEIDHCRKLIAEQRYDEAAEFVKPFLRKHDISAEFFDLAAIAADRRGKPAQAERYWRDLQRYYPSLAWGPMRIARFLLRQGRTREAHRVLDRARSRVQNPEILDAVLAEAAQASKQWEEAIRLWAALRRNAPSEIGGYLQGRACLLAVGRTEEADALLADISARMPNNPIVIAAVAAAKRAAAADKPSPPPPDSAV